MSAQPNLLSIFRHRRMANVISVAQVIVALTAFSILGFSARAWFSKPTPTKEPALAMPQGKPTPQRLEAELITITPRGFEPAEITRPAGRFFLAVDNRSGREEVQLRLDRVAGSRLREARVHRRRPDWRDLVDLTPGRYMLTEANNPAWACQITITAR